MQMKKQPQQMQLNKPVSLIIEQNNGRWNAYLCKL